MFNRTRKRMMLAALAAMSLAGAGAQGKADLPIDGTMMRTMAMGGPKRAKVTGLPTLSEATESKSTDAIVIDFGDDGDSYSFEIGDFYSETDMSFSDALDSIYQDIAGEYQFVAVDVHVDESQCDISVGGQGLAEAFLFGNGDSGEMDGVNRVPFVPAYMVESDTRVILRDADLYDCDFFTMVDGYPYLMNEVISGWGWDFNDEACAYFEVTMTGFNVASLVQDGETAEVYVNVDDPLTIDQVLANVSAEDLLGETVQVQCTETEKQKYKPSTLGVYKVTVTATDKYGQTATCYLNIHVVDTVPPEVTLLKALDFAAGETLQFSKVGEYVQVTDNGTGHGGSIGNATYTIDGQPFTSDRAWGPSDVGTHTLKVTVADSSGNTAAKEFQITVRDTQAPVITMRDGADGNLLIGLSRVLNFSESDFLALFQATDNVTPAGELAWDVEGDFIPSKVGQYDVKVVCTDKAGNKGSYTCHVTVDADLPPVFILSDALVGATAESPLSSAQIQSIVVNALYAGREVSDVLIDDSEYQANATRKGSYAVSYSVKVHSGDGSVSTEEGSLTVRVDDSAGDAEEEEETGWERFCEWWTVDFVRFWQRLGNWFRGVFTKFEWDCFITNEEWDARFPSEDAAE